MKQIKRDKYLEQLISKRENGMIKTITGIRRCGKSYLLDPIYKDYLIGSGVGKNHIIKIELDRESNRKYFNNPALFEEYIRSLIVDEEMYYLLIDEVQLVKGFELVLTGLLYEKNIDIYVTGSNSKFLSSDIITELRGRGDQIYMAPLSFSEYYAASNKDRHECWKDYITYGGMPFILSINSDNEKAKYLKDLFELTYVKDILERNRIRRADVLDRIINILASSVGSLTNAQRIFDTFKSNGEKEISINTINDYVSFIENSFIVNKAMRYDVKGRKYISTPYKYYFSDLGIRNARLNFRQQEETHLMENAIFNELIYLGFNVDVGVVEINKVNTEVDFICNNGGNRFYIQSALSLENSEKTKQESRSLNHIKDNFKKIILVKDDIKPWWTDDGIKVVGVLDFLTNPSSIIEWE